MNKRKTPLQKQIEGELEAIALANPYDFVKVTEMSGDEEVNYRLVPVPSEEISDNNKKAVEVLSQTARGIEVKLHNKLKAIEMLGKMNGYFEGKVDSDEARKIPSPVIEKSIYEMEEMLGVPHKSKRRGSLKNDTE